MRFQPNSTLEALVSFERKTEHGAIIPAMDVCMAEMFTDVQRRTDFVILEETSDRVLVQVAMPARCELNGGITFAVGDSVRYLRFPGQASSLAELLQDSTAELDIADLIGINDDCYMTGDDL